MNDKMKIHYREATYTSVLAAYRAIKNHEEIPSALKDFKWHLKEFGEYWLPSGNIAKIA